ncbi:unnamed protein product [Spirodela intermedia]|uniref:Uncharacterized protein n=1 Tax=Spirodela intermedia TaxID=51605 RepID=A0A7I8I8Y4_SPIIN|nr:unnamed protein product [Spirodela intermedia]CAA6653893.1 unnamed protein product [Spirodela intermedia]
MLRLLWRTPSSLRRPRPYDCQVLPPFLSRMTFSSSSSPPSSSSSSTVDDEWNDAWESAWLPDELSGKNRAPWETDVNYSSSSHPAVVLPSDADPETKAFVEEMEESWNERKKRFGPTAVSVKSRRDEGHSVEQVEGKTDGGSDDGGIDEYRLRKQRIHAGLWMKEIEAMEEAKLGSSKGEIFDTGNVDLDEEIFGGTSEFKNKPDGWELTSRAQDGNIWEISQREEDILLQEFERRIAYSKFQIASFIKSHIFSRRRPIDGWKYMIEELGPNARRGKGSAQRLPALADPSMQPFREEKAAIGDHLSSFKGR